MRKLSTISIGLAVLLAGYTAQAGYSLVSVVRIVTNGGANFVEGSVHDVRHSANSSEYLYCYARSWANSEQGVCYGQDAALNFKMCVTSDPEQIHTIRSIGSDSHVYFKIDANSNCEFITTYNGSTWID